MRFFRALCLLLLLSTACVSISQENHLKENYQTIQGYLASPPQLDNSGRLFLFIRPAAEDATGQSPSILMCITVNRERERILQSLQHALADEKELIFLYGYPITDDYEEYVSGINFQFVAVSYFQEEAEKYVTIMSVHGDSAMEVIRSAGWRTFLGDVVKQTIKRVITK